MMSPTQSYLNSPSKDGMRREKEKEIIIILKPTPACSIVFWKHRYT